MRLASFNAATVADVGVGVPTICPGDGGGGGTSGRATLGVAVAIAGVATDGVGRDGYGVPDSVISFSAGVGRRRPGMLDGVAAPMAGVRTGVDVRGVIAGFVNGVVAPTVIRIIAPQTLHRALTPFGGTFAGSTRKTDRQS
jgi:hypothetical protein